MNSLKALCIKSDTQETVHMQIILDLKKIIDFFVHFSFYHAYSYCFLSFFFFKAPRPPPSLSESAKTFLATLDNSSEEELTLHLQDRMQFSKGAVACMVCIFDRLHTTIDELCARVQSAGKIRINFV